jgi:hypothetical protein
MLKNFASVEIWAWVSLIFVKYRILVIVTKNLEFHGYHPTQKIACGEQREMKS